MSFCMTNGHTRQKKSRYHGIAQGTLFTCHMADWMGREFGREWIRIHVQLSHFAVHLKLPQHY